MFVILPRFHKPKFRNVKTRTGIHILPSQNEGLFPGLISFIGTDNNPNLEKTKQYWGRGWVTPHFLPR